MDLSIRGLWLTLAGLTAVFFGTVGGVLAWLGGFNAPLAILAGGSVFAGAFTIVLACHRFLAGSPE